MSHVTGIFTERPLRLDNIGWNRTFDNKLGCCRHQQVNGFSLNQLYRRAGQTAGESVFVEIVGNLGCRRIGDTRDHADGDARLESLAFGFALTPVLSHMLRCE